jgi:small-conductance mechanosensitive channel
MLPTHFQIVLNILKRIMLVLVISLSAVQPSYAQVSSKSQTPETEPIIELTPDRRLDTNIQKRISGIFSDFEDLQNITVSVDGGIVTLGGEVPNDTSAQNALSLTRRLEGVVSVNDDISRTLALKENIIPLLDNTKAKTQAWLQALPLIGLALFVFMFLLLIFDRLARLLKFLPWSQSNPFFAEFFAQILRLTGFILGGVISLNLLGATNFIAALLGGAGVIGLAVGFAVKDVMENYVSSIMLSVRQPFRAKDHVVINDLEGVVVRLTPRATILMTMDGNHLRIPNSDVFKGVILNYTTNPERRFDFCLGIDIADNPLAAMEIGLEALKSHDFILDDPKPAAIIKSVGDSNIIISFYGWVDQTSVNFFRSRSLAIETVMRALERDGLSLPEPAYRLKFEDFSAEVARVSKGGKPKATRKQDEKPPPDTPEEIEAFDISPDTHLAEKVRDEREQKGEEDLLDTERPTE